MSGFQIFGVTFAAVLFILVVAGMARRRLGRRAGFAWGLVWIAAGLTIARPELTVLAARALGIDRGADLVFYLGILAVLVALFIVFNRLRRLDEAVTTLVRHLAITEPDVDHAQGASGNDEPPR